MSKQQRIRLRLADGQVLSLKVVSIGFGDPLPSPPPDPVTFEVVDIRLRTQAYRNTPDSRFPDEPPPEPRPAPAGCPRCAHALSLMPDLSERIN